MASTWKLSCAHVGNDVEFTASEIQPDNTTIEIKERHNTYDEAYSAIIGTINNLDMNRRKIAKFEAKELADRIYSISDDTIYE